MKSAFPFKDPQYDYLHRSVVARIRRLDYHFELPYLKEETWTTICNNSLERKRLEFVGDAVIGAFIAEELYLQKPHGTPSFYTIARSILTANSTFAHLMHKAGLFHDLTLSVKPAGDAFETILAAFHAEQGVEAFQTYTRQYFLPLIQTASLTYDTFCIDKVRQRRHERLLKPMPPPYIKHESIKEGKKRARTTTLSVKSVIPNRTGQKCSSTSIQSPVVVTDLTEDSDIEEQSFPDGEMQEYRFKLSPRKLFKTSNKARDLPDASQYNSVSNNSTTAGSCNENGGLFRFTSAVVSARKDKLQILSTPTLGGHRSGEDAVQDDLITRFKYASLLGTIHDPIIID